MKLLLRAEMWRKNTFGLAALLLVCAMPALAESEHGDEHENKRSSSARSEAAPTPPPERAPAPAHGAGRRDSGSSDPVRSGSGRASDDNHPGLNARLDSNLGREGDSRPVPLVPGHILPQLGVNFVGNAQYGGGELQLGLIRNMSDKYQLGVMFSRRELNNGSATQLNSSGTYLTFSSTMVDALTLQVRAGSVRDTYTMRAGYPAPDFQPYTPSGRGGAIGLGLVYSSENLVFHLFDVERHYIGGQTYNQFSVTIAIMLIAL